MNHTFEWPWNLEFHICVSFVFHNHITINYNKCVIALCISKQTFFNGSFLNEQKIQSSK